MPLTWLHVSDFHVREGDSYDRDVVLRALVASVKRFREAGRAADVIFATGDIASTGKAAEYELASVFFDALLEAAGLDRSRLFVIAGNHDVDRGRGVGLARSLSSRDESDFYFAADAPRPHLTQKQGAFVAWYDDFFDGIRRCSDSTCGPVELLEAGGMRIGVLPINSALFCADDNDHAKLWVGRRALDPAMTALDELDADLRIALIHHPLDWLADFERSNIRATLARSVDVILRGHLHEPDVEQVITAHGGVAQLAAGAAYQTRRWPQRAMYVTVEGASLDVYPIRYEDTPRETWLIDPTVFPDSADHTGSVRLTSGEVEPTTGTPPTAPVPPAATFRSNIPSRRGLTVIGRDDELDEIATRLADPATGGVLVLSGAPGVGKSELAREYARRHGARYPGGTFFVDATSSSTPVDLARIAANQLGIQFGSGVLIEDQCEQAAIALAATPALLLYDNVTSFAGIERWLPPAGMPCQALITSIVEPREPGWAVITVDPLARDEAIELVKALAGPQVAETYGPTLAETSGGLPVQMCPVAAVLAYDQRRGRRKAQQLKALVAETRTSFSLAYTHLDDTARLLLHAAAVLNPQRIDRALLHQPRRDARLVGQRLQRSARRLQRPAPAPRRHRPHDAPAVCRLPALNAPRRRPHRPSHAAPRYATRAACRGCRRAARAPRGRHARGAPAQLRARTRHLADRRRADLGEPLRPRRHCASGDRAVRAGSPVVGTGR